MKPLDAQVNRRWWDTSAKGAAPCADPPPERPSMTSIACIPSAPAPGNAPELRERARGALLGLAVGDALGAPAENMKPSEIRARWGRITGYVAEEPAGTDDTEYAIFSGLLLARHGSSLA